LYSIDGVIGYPTVHDITIDHNTGFSDGAFIFAVDSFPVGTPQNLNCVFTNNIANHGVYGVFGIGATNEGTASLSLYFPGYVLAKNAIIGLDLTAFYPPTTFFPPSTSAVGFVNFSGGDYHLSASSPYKNAGTDGKDLGANIDAVNAATAGVK
jgi:hypothetical protein